MSFSLSAICSSLTLAWLPWFLAPDFDPAKAVNLQVRVYRQGNDVRGEKDRVIVCTCDGYSDSAIGFDYIGLHLSYQRTGHRVTARIQPEMQSHKNGRLRFVISSDWIGGGTKWKWRTRRHWFALHGNECEEFQPIWDKPCELVFKSEDDVEVRVNLPNCKAAYSDCPGRDFQAAWSKEELVLADPAGGELVFRMDEVRRSFSRGVLDGVTVLIREGRRFELTEVK